MDSEPPFRVKESLVAGWQGFQASAGVLIGGLLTIFLTWVVLEVVVVATQKLGVVFNIGVHLVFMTLMAGMAVGFLEITLQICVGQRPSWRHLFDRLGSGPSFFVGCLVYWGLVALGCVLFVLPGFYLGSRYSLFGWAIAAEERGLLQSFRRSAELSSGHLLALVRLLLTLLLMNLLGAALLGIGLLVSIPWSVLAMSHVFRALASDQAR